MIAALTSVMYSVRENDCDALSPSSSRNITTVYPLTNQNNSSIPQATASMPSVELRFNVCLSEEQQV